jgi:hypothetical protein
MAEAISNFAHCEALVREADPDRYWASLFAPAEKRPHLDERRGQVVACDVRKPEHLDAWRVDDP